MASILHRCPYCGYEADYSNTLPAFTENPHCQQCGLSASEGDMKMDDDLATLFARQMAVGNASAPADIATHVATPPTPSLSGSPAMPSTQPSPIVYSITQHYHHSSHQVNPGSHIGLSTEEEIQRNPSSAEDMLMQNGIDPSCLFPAQRTLFKQAGLEQRARLLELWRINPPALRSPSNSGGVMPYQNTQTQNNMDMHSMHSAPITQDDDMMDEDGYDQHNAEPYVVSGYESLAQREYERSNQTSSSCPETATSSPPGQVYNQSTDPAYKGGGGNQQQSMENQYGSFEAKRFYMGCGISRAHWLGEGEMLY